MTALRLIRFPPKFAWVRYALISFILEHAIWKSITKFHVFPSMGIFCAIFARSIFKPCNFLLKTLKSIISLSSIKHLTETILLALCLGSKLQITSLDFQLLLSLLALHTVSFKENFFAWRLFDLYIFRNILEPVDFCNQLILIFFSFIAIACMNDYRWFLYVFYKVV